MIVVLVLHFKLRLNMVYFSFMSSGICAMVRYSQTKKRLHHVKNANITVYGWQLYPNKFLMDDWIGSVYQKKCAYVYELARC